MRVRGQSPILWRRVGQSQLGAEPGHAVVIDGLSPQEQQLLDRLPADLSPDGLHRAARRSEVPLSRVRQILSLLDEAGVLTRDAPAPTSGDEIYWERLADSPRARTRALRSAVVGIVGAGRLTREILAILPEDEELSAWARTLDPPVRTRMPLGTRPHLVLTVEGHLIEPVRARGLAVAEVGHLPVVVREVSVRVGPFLGPDSPPCATCLDLWERDVDPQWPAVATQLRLMAPPQTESLLIHQAAALAARAATDVLTGCDRRWRGRSVEVSGVEAVGLERLWAPHPECLCSEPDENGTAAPGESADCPRASDGPRAPETLTPDPPRPPRQDGPPPSPPPGTRVLREVRPPRTPGA